MNLLRSPLSKLGASSAGLAKSALLAAAVLGGSLLAGGEVKASGGLYFCDFGSKAIGSNNVCAPQGSKQLGDKILSWVALPTGVGETTPPGFGGEIVFQWLTNPTPDDYTVTLDFLPNADSFAWNYTLAVAPGSEAVFSEAELDAAIDATGGGVFSVDKAITLGSGNVVNLAVDEGNTGPVFADIGGKVLNVSLSGTSCSECSFASVTDTYNQTYAVPGPLPLLGVGAAFGYSRRLRNRLKVHTEA